MRYKQKKRRSSLVVANDTIKERINGKNIDEIEVQINDKIVDQIEDTNDTNSEEQNESKDELKTKDIIEDESVVESGGEKQLESSVDKSVVDLIGKIAENDTYFSTLIDLIPAKIYFEGNEEILESMEQQKRDLFGDDLDLSKKTKQKRFKLDPNSGKKISEIANNFYNQSNRKSKQNQSVDNKMDELHKKLSERLSHLKSRRGQKAKNLRESKKERKKWNSLRASKQKGFSKRKFLETNDEKGPQLEAKPKKIKSDDMTDGGDNPKAPKNLPKIYNEEGNIVYSKFDLVTPGRSADKKNTKKNKLQKLLVKTKKEEQKMSELEAKNAPKAQEVKEKKLWRKAIDLSEGVKVRDSSKLIKKSLDQKRKVKIKSKKKWTERTESVEKSKAAKQQKRANNIKERNSQKKEKRFKRLKKKGRILDNK